VDYDAFPIDTGTIVASTLMGFGTEQLPVVLAANNLYHDAAQTETLGALAVTAAQAQGKRVAVVGIGGLSQRLFREPIDIHTDHIYSAEDDQCNRKLLDLLQAADVDALRTALPDYVEQARPDMGMKHLHWILGAMQGRYASAQVYGYEPQYGSAAAVVGFMPS